MNYTLPKPLEPDRVYILCVQTTRGWLGRAIQWVTRRASRSFLGHVGILSPHAHLGPYCHMALVSTFGRWWSAGQPEPDADATVYEATGDGYQANHLEDRQGSGDRLDIFEVTGLSTASAIAVVSWCEQTAYRAAGYDYLQLLGEAAERFTWGVRRLRLFNLWGTKKLICSEATALALRQGAEINICGLYDLSAYCPTDIRHTCDVGAASYLGELEWPAD